MEITKERLQELEDMESKMYALEAGGVDNWNGYDNALDEYNTERDNRIEREALRVKAEELLENIQLQIEENQYSPSEVGAGTATREDSLDDCVEMIIDYAIAIKKHYE